MCTKRQNISLISKTGLLIALLGLIAGLVLISEAKAVDPATDPEVDLGQWTTYNQGTTGFPYNYVAATVVDDQERLWIGTAGGGVGMFNGASWTTYSVITTGGGLASNNIRSLATAGDLVFVGTADAGISVYDTLSNSWTTYDTGTISGLLSDTIEDIAIDGDTWWFATPAGLTRRARTGNFIFWNTFTDVNSDLSDDDVMTLSLDALGRVWIGTCGGGVDRFDGSVNWVNWNPSNSGLPGDCVHDSVIANDGGKWFGVSTTGDIHLGVARFDGSSWVHYTTGNSGLSHDYVSGMAVDKANRVWMATWYGLSVFEGGQWNAFSTGDGLPGNTLITVSTVGERVWAGTWGQGVGVFDLNWLTLDTGNSGLAHNFVYSSLLEPGMAWFGTNGGLNRFDGTTWTTYTAGGGPLPHNQVLSIVKDGLGNYWIGTAGGIGVFDGVSGWTYHDTSNGLPYNQVNTMAEDSAGRMWAGTLAGAALYDSGWVIFDSGNTPLTSDNIRDLALDSIGRIWIATYGGGIGVFDGTGWEMHTIADGLPGNNVMALVNDGLGNMWAGTWGSGVGKYDGSSWTSYTTADGLPSDTIQDLSADSLGRVWVTTDDGGVARWSGVGWETFNLRNSGLADEDVLSAGVDVIGGAWFGTQGGGVSIRGTFFAPIGLPEPTISSFIPTFGPAGTLVTIFGSGFDDRDPSFNSVRLGLNDLMVTSVTSTTLQVEIPPYASSDYFTVETAGGGPVQSPTQFNVIPGYSYFEPLGGSPGQIVTIYGGNLHEISEVYFTGSGMPAEIESQGAFSIEVRVPLDAQSGPLRLVDPSNPDIWTSEDFTVTQVDIYEVEINQGLAGYTLINGKDTVIDVSMGSSSTEFPAYVDLVMLTVTDDEGGDRYTDVAWMYNTSISAGSPISATAIGTALFRVPGQFLDDYNGLNAVDYTFTISAQILDGVGTAEVASIALMDSFKASSQYWASVLQTGPFRLLTMEIEDSFSFADSTASYLGALDTLSRLLPVSDGFAANIWDTGGLNVVELSDSLRFSGYQCEPGNTDGWDLGTDDRTTEAFALLEIRRMLFNSFHPIDPALVIMGFLHNSCIISNTVGIATPPPIGVSIVGLFPGTTGPTAVQELGHNLGRVPPWAPNRCWPGTGCPGGGGLFDNHSRFQTAVPVGARAYNIFTGQNITANNPSVMSYANNQLDNNVLFEVNDYNCIHTFPSPICSGPTGSQPWPTAMNTPNNMHNPVSQGSSQDFILIGTLGSDESLDILTSMLRPSGGDYSPAMGEDYTIVFLQGETELSSYHFDPVFGHTHGDPDHPPEEALVGLRFPFPDGANRVEVRHQSNVLEVIEPGGAPPTVTLLSPNGGESYGSDEQVVIQWQGFDPDGDLLTYALAYSEDGGANYTVISAGITETQYTWETTWAAGSDQARIKVVVSDGIHTGEDASDGTFTVSGNLPMVAITSPTDGQVFSQYDFINLHGVALDLEDGQINGDDLTWFSDLDGMIGSGATLEFENPSLGIHVITLQASDGDGNTAIDQLTSEVQRDFDGDGLLDAYEAQYASLNFWDPSDATADGDGDELINLDEAFWGCHPEQADSDGDGAPDRSEVFAGSDCQDELSLPQLPELGIGPGSLTFTAVLGYGSPHPQGIEIVNAGGGSLAWTISTDVSWLIVDQAMGAGAALVEVLVDQSVLSPGVYQGQITIDGGPGTGNSPQEVPVSLSVLPGQNLVYLPIAKK